MLQNRGRLRKSGERVLLSRSCKGGNRFRCADERTVSALRHPASPFVFILFFPGCFLSVLLPSFGLADPNLLFKELGSGLRDSGSYGGILSYEFYEGKYVIKLITVISFATEQTAQARTAPILGALPRLSRVDRVSLNM